MLIAALRTTSHRILADSPVRISATINPMKKSVVEFGEAIQSAARKHSQNAGAKQNPQYEKIPSGDESRRINRCNHRSHGRSGVLVCDRSVQHRTRYGNDLSQAESKLPWL